MVNRCVQVVLVLLAQLVVMGFQDGREKLVVQETLVLQGHKVQLLSSLEVHTCILSHGSCSRPQVGKLSVWRATHNS